MTAVNGTLVDQIHQHIESARQAGKPAPGRARLARLTGATEHRVRQVLAGLASDGDPMNRDNDVTGRAGVRPVRAPRSWPLLVIGLGAAVAVWSGWVGLGELTGFGVVRLLPGLWDNVRVNSAVVLPLSVEAYGGYALRCWLGSAGLSERTRTFARRSAVTSLAIGALAQVAYHLMVAAGVRSAPWPVTVLVACVPVLVLGLATGLAALVKRDGPQVDVPDRERLAP